MLCVALSSAAVKNQQESVSPRETFRLISEHGIGKVYADYPPAYFLAWSITLSSEYLIF